jgi:hypothetical protein
MKAVGVGAGTCVLMAAIAPSRSGTQATVFGRAGEPRQVSAGTLLAANAVGSPDELEPFGKVYRLGATATGTRTCKRVGVPGVAVHRTDPQGLLLHERGAMEVLPDAGYTVWRGRSNPDANCSRGEGGEVRLSHIGDGRIYWFAIKNVPHGEAGARPDAGLSGCPNEEEPE